MIRHTVAASAAVLAPQLNYTAVGEELDVDQLVVLVPHPHRHVASKLLSSTNPGGRD
jgi:hypothetical protein